MAPTEYDTDKPVWQRWTFSYRALAYWITFFLVFALTCAELGLVSQQLHQHGNGYQHYPNMQYKHILGLLLFSSIATLLFCLTHMWTPMGFIPFVSLVLAVFWGVGAGLLRTGTPYRGASCDKPVSAYPTPWQPYADLCSRVVAIEGIAWLIWAILILLMVGSLIHKVRFTSKSTPEGMYFAKPEKDKGQA